LNAVAELRADNGVHPLNASRAREVPLERSVRENARNGRNNVLGREAATHRILKDIKLLRYTELV